MVLSPLIRRVPCAAGVSIDRIASCSVSVSLASTAMSFAAPSSVEVVSSLAIGAVLPATAALSATIWAIQPWALPVPFHQSTVRAPVLPPAHVWYPLTMYGRPLLLPDLPPAPGTMPLLIVPKRPF